MKPWKHMLVALLTIALIGSLVWILLAFQIRVSNDALKPVLYSGDRILVSRISCGLRLPFENIFGRRRYASSLPKRGDLLVFNDPLSTYTTISKRPLRLGICQAIANDTLWLQWTPSDTIPTQCVPLVIPSKGKPIDIRPWNIHLVANALHLYEGFNVCWDCDTLLLINGVRMKSIAFSDDYLWMKLPDNTDTYDSRVFGFLPLSYVIGSPLLITWSKDDFQPFYKGYRTGRFFLPLDNTFKPESVIRSR